MSISIRMRARRAWRRVVILVRRPFVLYEDGIRDEIVDGLRRDIDQLVAQLQTTINTLNRTNDRLAFYEAEIPALGKKRKAYDKKLRKMTRELETKNRKAAKEFERTEGGRAAERQP